MISGDRGIIEVLSLQFNLVDLLAWLGICVELDRYQIHIGLVATDVDNHFA